MKQESISDMKYSYRKRRTRRKEFLEIMDKIIPWEGRRINQRFSKQKESQRQGIKTPDAEILFAVPCLPPLGSLCVPVGCNPCAIIVFYKLCNV